jgi:hypothetical protein
MIPRSASTLKRRPVLEKFVFGGIEHITEWVMRSYDDISDEDERDIEQLIARVKALERAIEARKRAAGQLVEDE